MIFLPPKALVLDTCMGVVTAAMLERMGCKGRIIALYAQTQPSMDAVREEGRKNGDVERLLKEGDVCGLCRFRWHVDTTLGR